MYSKQNMESIKEGAYFDYLNFFSINAAETIRKLQNTFKDEISEDFFFDVGNMFKRVKTLLSSYQVLLMEIKDSCEFVQIPEFGVCIMKIFFQLMSIIKFMGKSIILRSGIDKTVTDKEKRSDQRHTMIPASTAGFYQKGIKKNISPLDQQRENFRMKEMASHIINDIQQQVADLQKQHKKDSLENDRTYEKISKGRQKLHEIQSSQSEAVLSETVNILCKKSEYINSFINIVQTNIALQPKQNCIDTYLKIKEQFDEDCAPRFEKAKQKLNKLFKQHVVNYQNKKKGIMVNFECQVKLDDEDAPEQRSKTSFHSKKGSHGNTNEQVKKWKNQVKSLEEQNKTLKVFIQQKCEQYQNLITKLRSQKISMQCKSNSENKSFVFDKHKSSSSKKSQIFIENNQNIDNLSQAPSHISVQSQNKQFFNILDGALNPVKKSKVSISANRGNRAKVKFNFNEKELSLCSNIVTWTIIREDTQIIVSGSEQKKIQNIEKINQTQFEKIQQRPSQLESSFRDSSVQISEAIILKSSKFKNKKSATSFVINRQFKDSRDSRQLMLQTDGFNKSKKNYNPICSMFTKKFVQKKDSLEHYVSIESQNGDPIIQKKSSKESSCAKISIFQRIQKQNEKIFSNQHQRSETFPIISIEPIILQAKKLKCVKFMEGIQIIQLQSQINFKKMDLVNIFFNEQNASNYQLLNLTLLSKTNQYFTVNHNKNIVIKDISKSANNSYKNLSPKYPQKQQGLNIGDLMVNTTYKYLKFLRQSKKDYCQKNYHIIKNFIRFPYSSVHKKNQSQWKQYETEKNAIQYLQLKKCICRILKLHTACKSSVSQSESSQAITPSFNDRIQEQQGVCEHWHHFFNKIGLSLIQFNK